MGWSMGDRRETEERMEIIPFGGVENFMYFCKQFLPLMEVVYVCGNESTTALHKTPVSTC